MVVRRTIHAMRQRPHEDRHAVAVSLAAVVAIILFLAWITLFFRAASASVNDAAQSAAAATSGDESQTLKPYGSMQEAQQDITQTLASSSDQFAQVRDQAYQATLQAQATSSQEVQTQGISNNDITNLLNSLNTTQ